jgi:hypothetical protein
MTGTLASSSPIAALLIAAMASLPAPSHAQTGTQTPTEGHAERLRALEQRQEADRKLIEQLRESLGQMSDGLSRSTTHTGVPIHGFADVGAAWSSRQDPSRLRGFGAGTLDLYLTPQFGDRLKSLIEIALYYHTDGSGEIEAERMQLGYSFDDSLTLWGGRFHAPFGLWNTAYHHGANLQSSIYRPRFIEFEDKDGVLPTHSVGVWGSGKTGLGAGKLNYDIYLTNGPTVRRGTLDYNAFSDDNSGKLLGFNVSWRPATTLQGATFGVHGFGSTVDALLASGVRHSRTRVRMLGGYLGYDAHNWEALAEYYRFANSDVATRIRNTSQAGYVQLGRSFAMLTPYVRHERAALNNADNFFATQRVGVSYSRTSIGARHDIDAKAALKVELGATREAAASLIDANGAAVAVGTARYRRLAIEYSVAF